MISVSSNAKNIRLTITCNNSFVYLEEIKEPNGFLVGGYKNITITDPGMNARVAALESIEHNYYHIQGVPAAVWLITHNLNKYPAVSIIDSADNEVVGEVEYIDLNNVQLTFSAAFSGSATLN